MKKTNNVSLLLQGDNMKKRTLIVVALAIVLALSFTTIATAKYAGAFRGETTSTAGTVIKDEAHGYLSWDGANDLWKTNTGATGGQVTAHGGYQISSVKCAVCHSAHRAAAPTTAGADWHLTMGGTCINCHTTWGAGGSGKQIEWSNPAVAGGGPHSSFNCARGCHSNGIHGGAQSAYHGNNVYLLGSPAIDQRIAADVAAGNISRNFTPTPGTGDIAGSDWFFNGTDPVPAGGGAPAELTPAGGASKIQGGVFAAAKGTATGYTCNQAGCHTNSSFAVNSWGFGQMQTDAVNSNSVKLTGHAIGDFDAHDASSTGQANVDRGGCSPCHPTDPAGGYRFAVTDGTFNTAMGTTSLPANTTYASAKKTAGVFGCDQCHDMVGKATNSTAWPHGNRNIAVYEWDEQGKIEEISSVSGGNLWMYQYSIGTTSSTPNVMSPADRDNSFRVVTGAVGGAATGNIRDGVCLKCHVPVDADSAALENIKFPGNTGTSMRVSGNHATNARLTVPADYRGSALIYLTK